MSILVTEVTLGRLGTDVVSHAEESLRSLDLLRAIEVTISGLTYDRKFYKDFADVAGGFARDIRSGKVKNPIDPEGKLEGTLSRAQEAAKNLYEALIEKRKAAQEDPDVTDEDCLVDEFTRTIAVLADLHNKLNDLRWAIGEHDADLEKPGTNNLKTPKEIEDALKSL